MLARSRYLQGNASFYCRCAHHQQLSGTFCKTVPLRFGSKKVCPQTLPSKSSSVISKWNDFSFWKCVKYIFFTGYNSQSGRGPEIEHGEHRKLRKLTSLLLEIPKMPQKFIVIPKLSNPSKVWNACLFWYILIFRFTKINILTPVRTLSENMWKYPVFAGIYFTSPDHTILNSNWTLLNRC